MNLVILSVFNTKDYCNCLSLIELCHEKSAILKNKGADQPHANYAAYQLLCLSYIDSTISVLQKTKFPASSHLEKINQSIQGCCGGGGYSKLAFDIINEHLYTPWVLGMGYVILLWHSLRLPLIILYVKTFSNSQFL